MGKTHKANDKVHNQSGLSNAAAAAAVTAQTPAGDTIVPVSPKDLRMTIDHKTHKFNEKIHFEELKAGHSVTPRTWGRNLDHPEAPRHMKKAGGGKGNWGREGDEIVDTEFCNPLKKARSNSKGHNEEQAIRSKFEENEEPIDESAIDEDVVHVATEDKVRNANA